MVKNLKEEKSIRVFNQLYGSLIYPIKENRISSKLWLCQFYCMDAPHGCSQNAGEKKPDGNYTRMLRAILN